MSKQDIEHQHDQPYSQRFEHHKERLRDAGYKLTQARLTVLEVIEAQGGHITSAEVLDAVELVNPAIGRASVFRTLDLLTRLNIVRPTFIDTSTTPYYVLMPDGHHHHIICVLCNRVVEFEDCNLSEFTKKLEAEYGFTISGHLLELYGKCLDCLSKHAH